MNPEPSPLLPEVPSVNEQDPGLPAAFRYNRARVVREAGIKAD